MSEDPQPARINPNQAKLEQLIELPGVGEKLAQQIQAARPYRELEDLARVSGLGPKVLARLEPHLTFEVEADASAQGEAPEGTDSEQVQVERSIEPEVRETAGRSGAFVQVLATSVLTGLLSVGLTLGILLAINGTLNMGRHRQVRALSDSTADLAAEAEALQRRLQGIDERLAALEGLSGRMATVEAEVEELQGEVDAAVEDVSRMRESVTAMERSLRSLRDRVDRFDAFLDGLRELLLETDGPGEAGAPESGTEQP